MVDQRRDTNGVCGLRFLFHRPRPFDVQIHQEEMSAG